MERLLWNGVDGGMEASSGNYQPRVLGKALCFMPGSDLIPRGGKDTDIQDEVFFLTFAEGQSWHKNQTCHLDHRGEEEK